jgi:hypothetical protein
MNAWFRPETTVYRGGAALLVAKTDGRGVHLVDATTGERLEPVPMEQLLNDYSNDVLTFHPPQAEPGEEPPPVDLSVLSDDVRAVVVARHAAIKPVLVIERHRRMQRHYEAAARAAKHLASCAKAGPGRRRSAEAAPSDPGAPDPQDAAPSEPSAPNPQDAATAASTDEDEISARSIRRWSDAVEAADGDIRVLAPKAHTSGPCGERALVHAKVKQAYHQRYLDDERPNKTQTARKALFLIAEEKGIKSDRVQLWLDARKRAKRERTQEAHDAAEEAGVGIEGVLPSLDALRMQVLQYHQTQDKRAVTEARLGPAEAEQQYDHNGTLVRAEWPLQRVHVDHTPLDLIVVDTKTRQPLGRPLLTYAVDDATGYPIWPNLSFEPEGYLPVMQTALRGMLPKPDTREVIPGLQNTFLAYGKWGEALVDGGPGFINRHIDDAFFEIKVMKTPAPARCPWMKGPIESLIGKLLAGCIHALPGTTFKSFVEKHGYVPVTMSAIDLDAAWAIIVVHLLDIYATAGLDRLGGESPRDAWVRLTSMEEWRPPKPLDARKLRIALGRVEDVVPTRDGINWHSAQFNSRELGHLRGLLATGEHCKAKVVPDDVGTMHVWHKYQNRWLDVPGTGPDGHRIAPRTTVWMLDAQARDIRENKRLSTNELAHAEADALIERLASGQQMLTTETRKAEAKTTGKQRKPRVQSRRETRSQNPEVSYATSGWDGGPSAEPEAAPPSAQGAARRGTPTPPSTDWLDDGGELDLTQFGLKENAA